MNIVETQLNEIEHALLLIGVFRPDESEPCMHATGFVVQIEEQVCLITAAHTIDELDKAREHLETCTFALVSPVPYDPQDEVRRTAQYVAFDYPSAIRKAMPEVLAGYDENVIPKELHSMDIGFVILNDYVRMHLEKMKVVPLAWDRVYEENEDELCAQMDRDNWMPMMVGFPRMAFVSSGGTSKVTHFKTLRLRLKGTDVSKRPIIEFEPAWDRQAYDGDVKGMSGCPVVLLGLDHLRVFAVQSAQYAVPYRYPKKLFTIESSFFFEFLRETIRIAEASASDEDAA